jgi:hypothetical protein
LACTKYLKTLHLFGFVGQFWFSKSSFLLMSKINRILLIFFPSKNIKKGARVLFLTHFHIFDLNVVFSKSVPNF